MRRWLALTLALVPFLSILSGIAVWIGQQQPLPDHIAMLHLNICKPPCWIGITPDITKWKDARAKLQEIFTTEQGFDINYASGGTWVGVDSAGESQIAVIENRFNSRSFVVTFFNAVEKSGEQLVHQIEFSFYRGERPDLANSYLMLGKPEIVAFNNASVLYYAEVDHNRFVKTTTIEERRLGLDHSVEGFVFSGSPLKHFPSWTVENWQGFASFGKYGR